MKKLLSSLFYSFALLAQSATYYVDFDGGNNSSAGTSTGAAWKHCPGDANATGTAASTTPSAGDTIYFKGGVRYKGSVTVNWSGSSGSPIVLDGSPAGWGTGRAIMDGTVDFTNSWTQCTSTNDVGGNTNFANIWYANANGGQTYFWQTVIVSNQFLPFAQDFVPTEPIWFDDVHNGWTNITTSGNVTTNFIKDSTYLTQPAGYWDGCWVGVFVDGNGTRFAAITNYFPATNTIRFALPPSVSFYATTKYSMLNNMRSITYEGQYALVTNRMYYWPLGGGNPNSQTVRVASLGNAFVLSNEQHVRMQGFQVEGYYSHVEAGYGASAVTLTSGTRNDGIRFTDNLVQFMRSMDRGPVINLQGTTNLVVVNNTLRQSLRNRGMIIQGHDVTVSSNLLDRIGSTGIYCAGVGSFGAVNTFINSNRVTGLKGVHGNGISLYQGSTNAVCAYNYIDECYSPLTYEEGGNITFHHNLIDISLGSLDEWGGMAGYVHWLDNTIVGVYSGGGFNVRWWDSGGPNYRIQNNIIEQEPPALGDIPANTVYSHNLFLTTNTVTLPPNCIIRTNKTLNFTAYKANMRPLGTFQGRDLGTNVSSFGVTIDMDGVTLDSAPDLGAWQYVAGGGDPSPTSGQSTSRKFRNLRIVK